MSAAQAIEQLKQHVPAVSGAVVVVRIGDFYEAFGDDAVRLSEIYGLTLTSRYAVPMAGFPYGCLDRVERELLRKGVPLIKVDAVY